MKPNRYVYGTIVLVTLAAVAVSAQETVKQDAVKTKDAIVKTSQTVADKTMDGLSKTGEVMTDAWVITRVHGRFVDEALLNDSDISVKSTKHVVTLKGTVLTKAGRTRAGTVALGTEGVHKVKNQLTIGPKRKS